MTRTTSFPLPSFWLSSCLPVVALVHWSQSCQSHSRCQKNPSILKSSTSPNVVLDSDPMITTLLAIYVQIKNPRQMCARMICPTTTTTTTTTTKLGPLLPKDNSKKDLASKIPCNDTAKRAKCVGRSPKPSNLRSERLKCSWLPPCGKEKRISRTV